MGDAIGQRPSRFSVKAVTPDVGWNQDWFHQASVSGSRVAFHQRIEAFSAGSPASIARCVSIVLNSGLTKAAEIPANAAKTARPRHAPVSRPASRTVRFYATRRTVRPQRDARDRFAGRPQAVCIIRRYSHADTRLPYAFHSGLTLSLTIVLTSQAVDAAQTPTGTVRVEVIAAGMPVAGATVSASGVSATTDASGVGTLTLPPGSARVVATKEGYQLAVVRIDVTAGDAQTVRLVLTPLMRDDGTVVSSTRTGQRIDDQAAVPIPVLRRNQVDATVLKGPGDIVNLFGEMPGIRMQTTSPVLGLSMVRIQGLPGRYTRLLNDGTALYSDRPGGYAPLRIPAMDIGQVEVINGPASAWYGSDALAGSVNLVSRRPGAASSREFLFNQSTRGTTDGMLWLASPTAGPSRRWSSTFLAGGHYQRETDGDDDGWSDIPGYSRGAVRQRVFYDNGQGRTFSGVAGVTFETREGGSAFAREKLETKTVDGGLSGQMLLDSGYILAGAGILYIQSREHTFSDSLERDRPQTATIEITLRRPTARHAWLVGIASDWYAIRSVDALPTTYVSTRPGIFFHDDWNVAPWLVLSGSVRADYHNLFGALVSPRGSALMRGGRWSARVSAAQGYFTPRPLTEETEAAGFARLTIAESLEVETARSVSADFTHRTRDTAFTLTLFRSQIDDPAQIDRATYTLRTETEPIVTQGVEIGGTARRAPFSVTGTYAYVDTRERDGRELALTPRHSANVIAAAESSRGRIGMELSYTGAQRLDANPYRSTSESYVLLGLLGEYRFGQWRLFVNAANLTDVRQTDWDPIQRPARDVDGRWTVDAWAPLQGRMINAGIRIAF